MAPPRRKCVFNADLEKKYPFIKKIENKTQSDVRCEVCKAEFNIGNAGKTDIEKHLTTQKHIKSLQTSSSSSIVNFFQSTDYSMAACEGSWAYHVVQSNHSFRSSDCSSKLLRTCFDVKNFHCARTKCEAIITNVLAPHALDELMKELSASNFICFSTDASNHSNVKMMPVLVRYFNPTAGVRVKMIEYTSQKGETADIVTKLILDTAEKNKLNDKIVGFCADNCPTNFGSCSRGGDKNVFHQLKQWNPSIIGIGCGAHITHNTLKSGCDCLPIDIETVVVKIYTYFKTHTVRVEALKRICEEMEFDYNQLLGYSSTRFLALGPACGAISKLFEPLKEYFMALNRCPTIIKSFFESPYAKLWLLFVKEQVKCDFT